MIDVMIDEDLPASTIALLPNNETIVLAVQRSCTHAKMPIEDPQVCIRFAHNNVVQALNAQWRGKDKVTDVLSFPMQEGDLYKPDETLGDIILAIPFVLQESQRLQREPQAHLLHLIIHGILHLLGHDHVHDDEAQRMQLIESEVLKGLGLHQPYADSALSCDNV